MKIIVVGEKETLHKYLQVQDNTMYVIHNSEFRDYLNKKEVITNTKYIVVNFYFNYSTDVGSSFVKMILEYVPEHLVSYTSKDIVSDTFEISLEDIALLYNYQ